MKLYIESCKMHIKSMLEYKKSFIIGFLSQFFVFFTYYFIILTLFNKFGNIKGFTVYEVLLTFSVIQLGYSLNEVFARGIDLFDEIIVNGEFDRLLVRPRSIISQLFCSKLDLIKTSRVFQSIIIMIIAVSNVGINWDILKIITFVLMIIASTIIFFSIFLFAASYCFVTVQGLEVRHVFTDGGKHMAQYPIGIFNKVFIFIFTFIIPYAFVNYYPLLYLLGKSNNKLYVISPLVVFIFLGISLIVFNEGTKKYISTGS